MNLLTVRSYATGGKDILSAAAFEMYFSVILQPGPEGFGDLPNVMTTGIVSGVCLTLAYTLAALISLIPRGFSILVMPVYAFLLGCIVIAFGGTIALFNLTFKFDETAAVAGIAKHTWLGLSGMLQAFSLAAFLACSAVMASKSGFTYTPVPSSDISSTAGPASFNLATRRIGV